MEWWTDMNTRRFARRDAENGIENNVDAVVVTVNGPRPTGAGEREDSALMRDEGREAELEAIMDETESLEESRTRHWPVPVYIAAIAGLFLIETGAAAFLWTSLGYSGFERAVLALGTAAGTGFLASVSRTATGRFPTAKRVAGWLVFLVLVVSIAWLRASSDQELPGIMTIAVCIVMLIATAAVSLGLGSVMADFNAANRVRLQLRNLEGQRRRIERGRERAQAKRLEREAEIARWEATAARTRAVYFAELRRTVAELNRKRA